MSVSPEVKAAVDRIRQDNDLISSLRAANALQGQQLSDIQSKYDALLASSAADHLSEEDKSALQQALDDAKSTQGELVNAVPANTVATDPAATNVMSRPDTSSQAAADRSVISGPSTADGGPPAPLMPTSAFDPAGGSRAAPADAGQPQQPRAIETPGGFVIAGGGATSRAPGSMPDSPSSSLVVSTDLDAKAPVSSGDVAKSGLGDSSQNAMTDASGRTAEQIAASQAAAGPQPEAEQARQDALADEREAREANPLNLAPAGTAQAGSPDADKTGGQRLNEDGSTPDEKAAAARRDQEAKDARAREQAQSDAEQGKPAPGAPGPDPVSAPPPSPPPNPAP